MQKFHHRLYVYFYTSYLLIGSYIYIYMYISMYTPMYICCLLMRRCINKLFLLRVYIPSIFNMIMNEKRLMERIPPGRIFYLVRRYTNPYPISRFFHILVLYLKPYTKAVSSYLHTCTIDEIKKV